MTEQNADSELMLDLRERLIAADRRLEDTIPTHWESSERTRLNGKLQGVRLALSYVDEALRTRPA